MNGRGRKSNLVCILALALATTATAQEPATPAEMAELAHKYEKGIGCPRDIGKALVYYKRAASQGDVTAMVSLGDLYREGICVEQDLKYSGDMYRNAAEAGFVPAMMRYGMSLERGGRLPEAGTWFRKAAAKGYGPAMTHLGDLEADGQWYRRAVLAKDPPAFARLAETVPSTEALKLLKEGAELGDAVAQCRYAQRIEKQDPAAAARLYRSAAEAGEPAAMSRLAWFAEKENNAGEAVLWYNKAAEKGDPEGIYWKAKQAEAESKPEEARRLYRIAVGKGHTGATARLAKLTGDKNMLQAAAEGGDADALYEVARSTNDAALMKRAADLGNVEALAATGDTEKAAAKGHLPSLLKLQHWEDAAKLGSPEGLYRWGLTIPDKADGTRYIRQAAEAGHSEAMRELAMRLESGEGAQRDPEAATAWYTKAARAGDPIAMYKLGDESSVVKAADAGYAPAMVRAADLTGNKTYLEKAAQAKYVPAWTKLGEYEKAAEAGDPEAKVALADKAKNPHKAYGLYLEAANAGYLPAMRRLAECHISGRGTSVSEIDGINWYRKAAQNGDSESLAILKQKGKTLY